MAQVRPAGCCWGTLGGSVGWDGLKRYYIGYCDKKPRAEHLTCWWHRWQEAEAQRLKAKDDKNGPTQEQ